MDWGSVMKARSRRRPLQWGQQTVIDQVHAPQKLSPRRAGSRLRLAFGGGVALCATNAQCGCGVSCAAVEIEVGTLGVLGLRWRRYDGVPEREGGGEDPVEVDQLDARRGNQSRKPLDEGEWGEHHMARAVTPGLLESVEEHAAVSQCQSLMQDGWGARTSAW